MAEATEQIRIGLIGGSGLGEVLAADMNLQNAVEHSIDTPFGSPSSDILTGEYSGTSIAIMARHGEGHIFNPRSVPYRANIFALKALGCTHIVASGATGSLREEIEPGHLVICDQLIDRTDGRERTFFDHAAVHVEFAEPFCPVMRRWLTRAAMALDDDTVHDRGTYICMEGPSFSTQAESHLHRQWGGDLIGMTAVPEARLAREAEMAYALVALPTDYDCWRQREPGADQSSLLQEIIANMSRAVSTSIALVQSALADVSTLRDARSPAHDALSLGIWSDKNHIPQIEIERLAVLWGRHFQP